MPDSTLAATSAGVTIVLIVPFVSRTFTGPGRSVKNIVPSDRKDMSHGLLRLVTKFAVASVGEFAGGPRPCRGGGPPRPGGGGGGRGGRARAGGVVTTRHPALPHR